MFFNAKHHRQQVKVCSIISNYYNTCYYLLDLLNIALIILLLCLDYLHCAKKHQKDA